MIPHAAVMKKFFSHKANSPQGESKSTTLATLAENIEEVFERRFYTTINNTRKTFIITIFYYAQQLFTLSTYRLDFSLLI